MSSTKQATSDPAEITAGAAAGMRKRSDLITRPVYFRGQKYWNVKDPLSLRFYQFAEEEFFVLNQLDGRTELHNIRDRFHRRFAPRRIELSQINAFLGMLHRESLVIADKQGQSLRLWERRRRNLRRSQWERLANLLAIRFRGVNPDPILSRLYPLVRWAFSKWATIGSCALIVAAFLTATFHFNQLTTRLPTLEQFILLDNVVLLVAVLAFVKISHELAHGLTCKHFGGRCHELGVMLLVFTPCLYCNVTDAWMLRSKWRRIAISAAGIYLELVLAAVAFFVWWLSVPGVMNAVALNVIVVCSVGTILFNGNPLLRYDGYFILADWLEVPNLREQAQAEARRWCLSVIGFASRGMNEVAGRQRGTLVIYGIVAFIYRWLLVVGIVVTLYTFLARERLHVVGQLLISMVLIGMLAPKAKWLIESVRTPGRPPATNFLRAAMATFCLLGLLGLLAIPLPSEVGAPAILEPGSQAAVYVTVPGTLKNSAAAGQRVNAGETLAELENWEFAQRTAELTSQRNIQQERVKSLQKLLILDRQDTAGPRSQLPDALASLADLEQRLARQLADSERLTLRAPRAGVVFPPPTVVHNKNDGLEKWHGSPLDPENQGCFLDRGTQLCAIGEPTRWEARLAVAEADVGLVEVGQSVRVLPNQLGRELRGVVVTVSAVPLANLPTELVASRLLGAESDGARLRPVTTCYEVVVRLDSSALSLPVRSVGQARISVQSRSLGGRLIAYLRRSFAR